jgi:hypothetical protein
LPSTERRVLGDRAIRIDDVEVGDSVHPHRHVVAGDHLLWGYVQGHRPQVDPHHAVDDRDQQDQAGALLRDQAAEPEDHGALILPQHADRRGEQEQSDEDNTTDDPEPDAHCK